MNFIKDINTGKQIQFCLSILFLFLIQIATISAQETVVRGTITDAKTGEPLISASISFEGTTTGTNTDFNGEYELSSANATETVVFSYLGYQTFEKEIKLGKKQTVNVKLEENAVTLEEAVVVYKEKYRNKDNPAVLLIKKVIEEKENNRSDNYDYYQLEKYEKVMLGLSNVTEKFKSRKAFKKVQFLFEEMDTTSIKGGETLPIYLRESLSDIRYRKSPEDKKEVVLADTMVTFDGYADNDGFNQYLDNLYQNVDIYDDNIVILNQQFLSPIAGSSPTFYKFYIQDTVQVDGINCVELFFAPRNKLDILFQGYLYIAYEDNYNVKKVDMSVNSNISLNWVKSLTLSQTFEKIEGHGYIQTKDEFAADFGLTSKGMGMFGKRNVSNEKIRINEALPDEAYKGQDVVVQKIEGSDKKEFWEDKRHDDLTRSEEVTYEKIDSLQNLKVFKRVMNLATLALSGYTNITPYFELGPVNTFYSFNPIEGFRPRLGGRTTPAFSEKTEIETYAVYGFLDKQWKGYLGLSQALKNGNLQKFPVRRLRASYQKETAIPGQVLQFVQEDNLLLSFKRGVNNKYLYNTTYKFDFTNEFKNNLMFSVGMSNWQQSPAGDYQFLNTSDNGLIDEVTTTEVNTVIRWAPGEQFYQGKIYRIPIVNRFPILTLRYDRGVKGILGSGYDYDKISLKIYKRFFLSRLGYSDVFLEGGAVLGTLPYPLMTIHAANQTYAYQLQTYNLMNFLEFVSDRYISFSFDHDFNGFFLNRIPLIRKLKLREAVNARVLYGGITDKNNPNLNEGLIAFPRDESGNLTTFSLEEKPYIEASIGLANIFRFFRVDLVKRFTYLDNPNVAELGVRARFKVYF